MGAGRQSNPAGLPAHCEPHDFMISIKLMTDGIIRGSGAMAYFVLATVPDLILRIIVANILTGRFGSMGIWMAWPFGWIAATVLTVIFTGGLSPGSIVSGCSSRMVRKAREMVGIRPPVRPSCKCEAFVNPLLWKHLSLEPEKCLC